MNAFRNALSFWNEFGLVASGCILIGYFGSRGLLGFLPTLAAVLLILGGFGVAWMIAKGQAESANEDEWGFNDRASNPFLDKLLIYFGLFIFGVALFVTLGLFI